MLNIEAVSKKVVENAFFNYLFNIKPKQTRHALLSELFPEEYVAKSALLGLETSLGTSLWENLATSLAKSSGFNIEDKHTIIQQPILGNSNVANAISQAAQKREAPGANLSISNLSKQLNMVCQQEKQNLSGWKHLSKGTGIDIAVSKGGKTWVFDIKTVQLNAGSGPKFSRTLIEWHTYWMLAGGNANDLTTGIAIPYNPYIGRSWWSAQGSRVYPLDNTDVFLENEFWTLLTGAKDAFERIQQGFTDVKTSEFLSVHTKALFSPSIQSDCLLLEFHKGLIPTGSKIPTSRRARVTWSCNLCSDEFHNTINQAKFHSCADK